MPGHVYKRNKTFWVKFYANGKAYYRSAKTENKRQAERILQGFLAEVAADKFKGFHDDVLSMRELFDDFVADCTQRKLRSVDTIGYHMKALYEWFGAKHVGHVNERDIDRYIKHRLSKDRAVATINREIQYLTQAYRLAQRKKLIETIPYMKKFREDNVRQGFFEREQFERLVTFLPDDLKDFVRFAYYSGWRKGEIVKLEWRDIEGDVIRLRPETVKTKEGRVLVLVGELAEIIVRRRAIRLDLIPRVFFREGGARIGRFDKSWNTACKKAGLAGRVFHDLRRTTVRNLSRAGVPDKIAMEITGHLTHSTHERYNIVNESDIRDALLKQERHFSGNGYKPVTGINQR